MVDDKLVIYKVIIYIWLLSSHIWKEISMSLKKIQNQQFNIVLLVKLH